MRTQQHMYWIHTVARTHPSIIREYEQKKIFVYSKFKDTAACVQTHTHSAHPMMHSTSNDALGLMPASN